MNSTTEDPTQEIETPATEANVRFSVAVNGEGVYLAAYHLAPQPEPPDRAEPPAYRPLPGNTSVLAPGLSAELPLASGWIGETAQTNFRS
jgi:hypothetical protein